MVSTATDTCALFMALYGTCRVTSSHKIMPKLNTSAFSVYRSPAMTSGAIHWNVPHWPVMTLIWVFAIPKSHTLDRRFESNKTLGDLRSRWMMIGVLRCKKLIPRANYRVQMYGTWYKLDLRNLTLAGIDERAVAVCTRTGLTAQTQDRLIWRCPA